MNVVEIVRTLISDQGCGILAVDSIREDGSLYDAGFDSLRFMELVVLLEERFGIQFPDEHLEISEQTKVSDIVDIVRTEIARP